VGGDRDTVGSKRSKTRGGGKGKKKTSLAGRILWIEVIGGEGKNDADRGRRKSRRR